jgi:uncharacterized protein with HEPN domain
MSRDNESLVDIVQAIQKILRFTQGVDQNQFETNEEKQSATLYQWFGQFLTRKLSIG